ncbi:MAG TPA: transcriptional regulator [Firmicutes bacterium]|nr:transcriptional regulator [Bacillota bacterium]
MNYYRIGDKVVDVRKIHRVVDNILELRSQGKAQQEVAKKMKVDRTFISRLETIGEVRKGKKIALIGFPLKNVDEITAIAEDAGCDFILLMTDEERWDFVKKRTGMVFFNEVMQIIARLRELDTVIVLGSPKWVQLAEALFDNQVLSMEIGKSPIENDVYLNPVAVKELVDLAVSERRNKK